MELENLLSAQSHKHWVIGVSGGPDSMALLDIAFKSGVICHVLHVNYHQRETAGRDQRIVEDYCHKHDIELTLRDAPANHQGNFQNWARNLRYGHFAELVQTTHSEGVLIAHHQDDDLETVLLQIRRKTKVAWYGLQEETKLHDIRVLRPLLGCLKQDLLAYCATQCIPYGLDESNLSPAYLRNRIRQELAMLNEAQKRELSQTKQALNRDRASHLETYGAALSLSELDETAFRQICSEWPDFLFEWLRLRTAVKHLSLPHMREMRRQIQQADTLQIRLDHSHRLIKQYGTIRLARNPVAYSYRLEAAIDLETPYFKLSCAPRDKYEMLPLSEADFPLTIRNADGHEQFMSAKGTRKLARWFISHKIPMEMRESWPIVLNAKKELIFIPRCKIVRSVNSAIRMLYMIK